jgi:hypothetical protein
MRSARLILSLALASALLLVSVVPAAAGATVSSGEVKATEFNDAREPLAIPCDDKVYTSVDGYFLVKIVIMDDGTGQVVARTDNERPVIVEDQAGGQYLLQGILSGRGSFTGEGDVVQTAQRHMRVFDIDGGSPVEVINAIGVGVGGDAIAFTPLGGTCESMDVPS